MWLHDLLELVLHVNRYLDTAVREHGAGPWIYATLFAIVFCETGLVVTPFLPGDSLIFAVGALVGAGTLDPTWAALALLGGAFLGDNVNYRIGRFLGPKVLTGRYRLLKKEYLDRTHKYFETYGGKTIIIARFVPIVRTFAPFVAGVGSMPYWRFLAFSLSGGLLWVGLLLTGGYLLGQLAFVKDHFGVVELAIIIISLLPIAIEYWRHRNAPKAAAVPEAQSSRPS